MGNESFCDLEQFLAYKTGLLSGLFYKVLGNKDLDEFQDACLYSLMIILGIVVVMSSRQYTGKVLIVRWRRKLCLYLHHLYLRDNAHYKLLVLDEEKLDNPDQRITSDVNSVTSSYGKIVSDLVLVPVLIGYYTYDAYTRAGWLGPTAMYIYFIISTSINKLLMAPVVRLTVRMEQKEGDFRFKHMELRSHAESLALSGSVDTELDNVNNKLMEVCGVQQMLYNRNFPIDLSINLFNYVGAILSYVVIAVPIFSGVYDHLDNGELAQMISETGFVCMSLVYQLTKLVNITSTVAGLAGSTHRVTELVERLVTIKHAEERGDEEDESDDDLTDVTTSQDSEDSKSGLLVKDDDNEDLVKTESEVFYQLENVSFKPPGWEKDLIHDLSLTITEHNNLLIIGQSGCGKSSLVRVVRGLWPHTGHMEAKIKKEAVMFLAQSPFLSSGSLVDQVTYPEHVADDSFERTRVLALMSTCHLSQLMSRYGDKSRDNWYNELSPGEQQRLAWCRILYHKPRLAVLDEATSGVSEDLEAVMYNEAIQLGITLISVGHRGSLRQYHQQILVIGGQHGGSWSLGSVEAYNSQRNLFVTNSSSFNNSVNNSPKK